MLKKNVMIPVILMALAVAAWWQVLARERAFRQAFEMTQVLVARTDLPAKTLLSEELVETLAVPRRYMQQDAYEVKSMSDVKLVNGLVLAVRIPKGNQVIQSAMVSPGPAAKADMKVRPAQLHYLSGLKYFQNGDYEKARGEWKAALELDPSNADSAAGLERIDRITGGK